MSGDQDSPRFSSASGVSASASKSSARLPATRCTVSPSVHPFSTSERPCLRLTDRVRCRSGVRAVDHHRARRHLAAGISTCVPDSRSLARCCAALTRVIFSQTAAESAAGNWNGNVSVAEAMRPLVNALLNELEARGNPALFLMLGGEAGLVWGERSAHEGYRKYPEPEVVVVTAPCPSDALCELHAKVPDHVRQQAWGTLPPPPRNPTLENAFKRGKDDCFLFLVGFWGVCCAREVLTKAVLVPGGLLLVVCVVLAIVAMTWALSGTLQVGRVPSSA